MKAPHDFTTSEQVAPRLSIKHCERKNKMRTKKNKSGWIIGLAPYENTHQVNGVTYVISSQFEPQNGEAHSLRSRMERLIQGNSVSLTRDEEDDIITVEYVSAAHPNSDRKEKYAEESSSQTT